MLNIWGWACGVGSGVGKFEEETNSSEFRLTDMDVGDDGSDGCKT